MLGRRVKGHKKMGQGKKVACPDRRGLKEGKDDHDR